MGHRELFTRVLEVVFYKAAEQQQPCLQQSQQLRPLQQLVPCNLYLHSRIFARLYLHVFSFSHDFVDSLFAG